MSKSLVPDSLRDSALDIALLSRGKLQDALNSGKHGLSDSIPETTPLTIRNLLYTGISDTKTVTIDNNSTKYLVMFKWYSLCNIKLKDVFETIHRTNNLIIYLSNTKLDLYVMSAARVANELAKNNKDISVSGWSNDNDSIQYIILSAYESDVLNRTVRKTTLDCTPEDWNVVGETGTIFTTFRGNVFENVMQYCDVTLSTDVDITVGFIGRINAINLYNKYLTCINKEIYLAGIFCTNDKILNTYKNTAHDSPIKRMSVRDQVNTLIDASLNKQIDKLHSRESRLMVGVDLE